MSSLAWDEQVNIIIYDFGNHTLFVIACKVIEKHWNSKVFCWFVYLRFSSFSSSNSSCMSSSSAILGSC